MILRRVIAHFRKQEWTAIAIDFLIVVTGVFFGIQVSNWNETRKETVWEQAFFHDLTIEMQENRTQLAEISGFQTAKSKTLNQIRDLLDEGVDEALKPEIEQKFFFAESSNRTFFPTKGVYLSALSSGRIDQIEDSSLKYAIMNLYEHFYTRLVYNGEIYDDRADQVSWAARYVVDSKQQQLRSLEAVNSEEFRSYIGFLSDQSAIYAKLAEDNLIQTDRLIGALKTALGEGAEQ